MRLGALLSKRKPAVCIRFVEPSPVVQVVDPGRNDRLTFLIHYDATDMARVGKNEVTVRLCSGTGRYYGETNLDKVGSSA
jgi:hypothetical protein